VISLRSENLHLSPKSDAPPVPVRLPGKRWSNWALHGIVWHCATRMVVPGKRKHDRLCVASMPVIVRFEDGVETLEMLRAEMDRPIWKGTKQHPGMTPLNLLNYTTKKLAWILSMALSYGHIVKGHRVPIKGIWIVHEPSNTKTWLPSIPARKYVYGGRPTL
jgi:hypothetical protein